jgi:hypothetical protein
MSKNPRDHGLGASPKVLGAPTVVESIHGEKCPNCGCQSLFGVEVEVEPPSMLRRPETPHKVVGVYVGCPACPWASPMMTTTRPVPS